MKEDKKIIIRKYLDDYLNHLGIDIRENFKCFNSECKNSKKGMYFDRNNNIVCCLHCSKSYDIFDLISIKYNIADVEEQYNKIIDVLKLDSDKISFIKNYHTILEDEKSNIDNRELYKTSAQRLLENNILKERFNIDDFVVEKYKVGCDENNNIIIPINDGSYLKKDLENDKINCVNHRFAENKINNTIFNYNVLKTNTTNDIIVITTDIIDSLIISSIDKSISVIAVHNKADVEQVKKNIKNNTFVLMLPSSKDKQELLKPLDTSTSKIRNLYYETSSNIIDRYLSDKENMIKDFINALISVEELKNRFYVGQLSILDKDNCYNYFEKFKQNIDNNKMTGLISTGYSNFDKHLQGGFKSGLCILGAMSSMGKTSLAINMAMYWGKNGRDVIIFSLEMGKDELIAKMISKLTLEIVSEKNYPIEYAKSYLEILYNIKSKNDDIEIEVLEEAYKRFNEYSKYITIIKSKDLLTQLTVNNIINYTADYQQFKKTNPIVVIDYLQIIANVTENDNVRLNVDLNVSRLRNMAIENNLFVLLISSLNRNSSYEEITMTSFKESGGIEYGADYLLALQPSCLTGTAGMDSGKNKRIDEYKKTMIEEDRKLDLLILKNRAGEQYSDNGFVFNAKYSHFEEI